MMHRIPPRLLVVLLCASCATEGDVGSVQPSLVSFSEDVDLVTNRIVVIAQAEAVGVGERLIDAGFDVLESQPEVGLFVVSGDATEREELSQLSGVLAAVPDIRAYQKHHRDYVEVANPPNSGDDDFAFDLQWNMDAIDAPEAWAIGARGRGARVAVIDDGVDPTHPDLVGRVRGDLSISFVPGQSWDDPASAVHGTAVASVIAASDNGTGLIGVAPEAEIIAIKALVDPTSGAPFPPAAQISWVIQGVVYAAQVGVDAINLSLGILLPRAGGCDLDRGFICLSEADIAALMEVTQRTVSYAREQGAVVVAAASNEGINRKVRRDLVLIPGDLDDVIAVAATAPQGWALDPNTNLDVPTRYTNYGIPFIDVSAPGGDVYPPLLNDPSQVCSVSVVTAPCFLFDTIPAALAGGGYFNVIGTSFAAPHAVGVIALIAGEYPKANASVLRSRLLRGADDVGKRGRDPYHGRGRVNAYQSVR